MNQTINSEVVTLLGKLYRGLLSQKKGLAQRFGLTLGQSEVLGLLRAEDQKTVPQMARALRVSRQNVQVVTNKLLGLGLIFLTSNPDHQLSPLISLTEKGGNVSKAFADQEEEIEGRLFEKINIGEKTLLLRVLKNSL